MFFFLNIFISVYLWVYKSYLHTWQLDFCSTLQGTSLLVVLPGHTFPCMCILRVCISLFRSMYAGNMRLCLLSSMFDPTLYYCCCTNVKLLFVLTTLDVKEKNYYRQPAVCTGTGSTAVSNSLLCIPYLRLCSLAYILHIWKIYMDKGRKLFMKDTPTR